MVRGTFMESIIEFKEGDMPSTNRCFFCNNEAPFIFGIINKNQQYNIKDSTGYKMDAVCMCEVHAEAFNSLLSGEHDVNALIDVMKNTKQRKINLRR